MDYFLIEVVLLHIQKLAGHFAALIAVMSHVGKAECKTKAIRFVTARLNHQGITLPQPVISAAVEKAFSYTNI
ncbi:hypothetical protein [Levilactobacillus brevis]|jgi:hypothetical protein|uniref:hypothetical protein n=1 Tax=Levilactobacillus brevis TaxID=1580 RepID=UPI001174F9B6|nr:hypothetical protein [Levilactobacillus brevis]MBL3537384.1 hypothetical protein [Lactobacillus sp. GPR40-2]MBX6948827.1 hypothetical protein [Levilactobacillus brevis]MCM6823317.1 hypothetical protein [Levilactobacillus brevis]ULH74346.1 hypothetical protein MD222_11585 [Levilactobacillus brevis]UVW19282.1 hypothetical protein NX820_03945 [Levilactobacillus brevis]